MSENALFPMRHSNLFRVLAGKCFIYAGRIGSVLAKCDDAYEMYYRIFRSRRTSGLNSQHRQRSTYGIFLHRGILYLPIPSYLQRAVNNGLRFRLE